jgi:dinuclear metal center YbgI/SA1388 family protein
MEIMERIAPAALALPGDTIGLQAGDPASPLTGVVVALDPSDDAVDLALSAKANVIVTHHPLIYRPLDRIVPDNMVGELLLRIIGSGLALYVAHTNLDRALRGVNAVLAETVGLRNCEPLNLGNQCAQYKLVVFVPKGHEDQVRNAACSAGAGVIGEYEFCTFQTEGVGTFVPGKDAQPFSGEVGELNREGELRLEMVVSEPFVQQALEAMKLAHPYEEVAYDLLVTSQGDERFSLGRIGELDKSVSLEKFASHVKKALKLESVRVVGDVKRQVSRIATIAGSGGKFVSAVAGACADVLVTGDVGYHQAREARARDLCLIDAGHAGTERIIVAPLADTLQGELAKLDPGINVQTTLEQAVFVPF